MPIFMENEAPIDSNSEAQKIPPQALEAMGQYLRKMVQLDPSLRLDNGKVEEAVSNLLRLPEVQELKLDSKIILEATKNILEKF